MSQLDDLLFETERRSALFHRGTSMPDGSQLGYDGDPNAADPDSSDGEFLLYHCPSGTRYLQKNITPYLIWEKLADGAGGIWSEAGGSSVAVPETYLPTTSPIGGNRAIAVSGGYAVYADHDLLLPTIGISKGAVELGADVAIQVTGKMLITDAGFIQDQFVFVGANGVLNQAPDGLGITQKVGTAISNEVLLIEIAQPIFK